MRQTQADRRQAEHTSTIAELAAIAWLVCTGHRLLARRYWAAGGEINLAVRCGRVIIFCEVKYQRTAGHDGMPSPAQQRRICNAAREFIARHQFSPNFECHFDLLHVPPVTWRENLPLQHLRNAWWCDLA